MAPRKETVPQRNSLLAILLADTFQHTFDPVTNEIPSVLLPLVNVPLIEYTLEWLAANDVQEVLVFCCLHAEQIASYLETSKWTAESEFMSVRTITGSNCCSVGDAMRFIDQLHIIKRDFLILRGDHVTNLTLKTPVEEHRTRRETDSNAIMTVVMTEGHDLDQHLYLGESNSHAIIDADAHRLLAYKESASILKSAPIECDTALFSERDAIQVRADLMDTRIYICSPEVLALFSDNFDYQDLTQDFIGGVLSEEELGNKIFYWKCDHSYVQYVDNLRRYDAVSRDVMARWTFPFCPDTRIFSRALKGVRYQMHHGHQYFSTDARLPAQCSIGQHLCIGKSTVLADACLIESSVIGEHCVINRGAQIRGSYLHENVIIGENVHIHDSMICGHCVIHKNAVISRGCLLSIGVVISPGHTVPPHTLLSLCTPPKGVDETEEAETAGYEVVLPSQEIKAVVEKLGDLKTASQIHRPAYFDDVLVGRTGAGARWPGLSPSLNELLSIAKPCVLCRLLARMDRSDDGKSDDQSSGDAADADQLFEREVAETFLRCMHQKFNEDTVVLELNGLRLAELRAFVDCASHIFTTLLQLCLPAPSHISATYRHLFSPHSIDFTKMADRKRFLNTLEKYFQDWSSVLGRFLNDKDDQVELMFSFEEFFKGEGVFNQKSHWGPSLAPVISNICELLYDNDVVTEDAFLSWAREKGNATEAEDLLFYNKAKKFIDWLKEAEETTDSE